MIVEKCPDFIWHANTGIVDYETNGFYVYLCIEVSTGLSSAVHSAQDWREKYVIN